MKVVFDLTSLRKTVAALGEPTSGKELQLALHSIPPNELSKIATRTIGFLQDSRSGKLIKGATYIGELLHPHEPALAIELLDRARIAASRSSTAARTYELITSSVLLYAYYLEGLAPAKPQPHFFDCRLASAGLAPRLTELHQRVENYALYRAEVEGSARPVNPAMERSQCSADFIQLMAPHLISLLNESSLPMIAAFFSWRLGLVERLPTGFRPSEKQRQDELFRAFHDASSHAQPLLNDQLTPISYASISGLIESYLRGAAKFAQAVLRRGEYDQLDFIAQETRTTIDYHAAFNFSFERTLLRELYFVQLSGLLLRARSLFSVGEKFDYSKMEQRWKFTRAREAAHKIIWLLPRLEELCKDEASAKKFSLLVGEFSDVLGKLESFYPRRKP